MNIWQFILLAIYTFIVYNVGHYKGFAMLMRKSRERISKSPELQEKLKAMAEEYKGKL